MASARVTGLVRFGAFEFDLATRELRKHGIRIKVADQSLEILAMLVAQPGKVVSREAIRARLWPHGTVVEFEHSVNSAMKRLRDALSDAAVTPSYIETLPKKGYRFIAALEPDSPLPGIRNYRIVGELGRGGMGVVYRAVDVRLGREVAIKVLPAEFASDLRRRARLMREARAASSLNHPNIVTVYEVGSEGGADFIAMELVAGKPLSALIPPNGMPPAEVVKLATQISDGMAQAHSAGVVHRDLKPGNIMVTDEGRVKLLDFGLAKATDAPAPLDAPTSTAHATTAEGEVMGTTGYMSPEQAAGRPVDARSDIFAFAVVLYEMLSGRPAFQKDSYASTVAAILTQDPVPLPPRVPDPLQRIVARCLRKNPEDRFQTMADVRVELHELEHESGSDTLATSARAPHSRKLLWWMIAGIGGAAIVSAAILTWRFASQPAVELNAVALTSDSGFESEPSFSPDGSRVAYVWDADGANPAPGFMSHGGDIYVRQIGSNGPPVPLTSRPEQEFSPAWSPDDRWIAFQRIQADGGLAIVLIPPLGGPERTLHVRRGGNPGLSWTPDAKWLVYNEADPMTNIASLWAISVESGERRRVTAPQSKKRRAMEPGLGDCSPSVSPDGRTVAFVRFIGGYVAEIWSIRLRADMAASNPERIVDHRYFTDGGLAWTPDGRDIVYSAGMLRTRSLWRVRAAGRRAPQRLSFAAPDASWPTLAGKTRRLLYGWKLHNINVWRLDTRTGERRMVIGSTYESARPQYSPDGRRIAVGSNRSGDSEIWTCGVERGDCIQVTNCGLPGCGSPAWSPDGARLAFDSRTEGQSEIYTTPANGGVLQRMTNDAADDTEPSWSADGQWIYFTSDRTDKPEIWRMPATGGSPVRITYGGAKRCFASRDGNHVYYTKFDSPAIYRCAANGGPEEQVVAAVTGPTFGLTANGVYFLAPDWKTVQFLEFATRQVRTISKLDLPGYHLTNSPDGRYVIWQQQDKIVADIMLVENFR